MSRYVDLDGLTWDGTTITSKIQEVKTKTGYMMSGITTGWLWCDSVPHIDLDEHDKQIREDVLKEFINKFVKRNQLKQMTKSECINSMYILREELLKEE